MFYKHLDTLTRYIESTAQKNNIFIKIHDYDGFITNSNHNVKTVFGKYPHYCAYVRSDERALRYCLEKEIDVMKKCEEGKPFYGTCYAGIKMYIVPMFYEDKLLGFVSAGRVKDSYDQAQSRISRSAQMFNLDPEKMSQIYFDSTEKLEDLINLEDSINMIASALELLRVEFLRTAILQGPADNKKVLCRKIIDYIHMAYMGNLTLDVFTNYFNCSRSLISHSFKAQTGITIKQYINKVRLDKATEMLANNDYSVNSVARGVGFEDTNYFIKLFKKKYGCTPGEYRRNNQEK